jgi:hypothetical protein
MLTDAVSAARVMLRLRRIQELLQDLVNVSRGVSKVAEMCNLREVVQAACYASAAGGRLAGRADIYPGGRRDLERIASVQQKTVQELAVERLRLLVEGSLESKKGSPGAVLRAMREPPDPSASDVEELEAAIAAGRAPVQMRHLFSD